ncbi:MAG: response regulator transcription factor [Blastochloris sp.]|nr:response regulator transcription factor [Blastochloris sp.]
MSTARLSVSILDDEPIALLQLQTLLGLEPGIKILSASTTGSDFLNSLKIHTPDAVFLDIQMPETTGFEIASQIPASIPIIFVTASETHAIRAFEVNALDYLVKPVTSLRLKKSLARLLNKPPGNEPTLAASNDLLYLPLQQGRVFIQAKELVSIESKGNYSQLHLQDGRSFLVKRSLRIWSRHLDPLAFIRIHRGCILHLCHIDRVEIHGPHCTIHVRNQQTTHQTSRRQGRVLKSLLKASDKTP